jgi:hypothetical protein
MLERATPEGGWVITYHDVTDLRRASEEIENLAFLRSFDRSAQPTSVADRLGRHGAVPALGAAPAAFGPGPLRTSTTPWGTKWATSCCSAARLLPTCAWPIRWLAWGRRVRGDVRDLSTNTQKPPPWPSGSRKILRGLSEPYVLRGHVHQGAASIGATLFGASAQSASELLRQADIAMYQVCRGNALCFFDPKMQTAINDRAQLEADLRQALITQQLVLHFQPRPACRASGRRVPAALAAPAAAWFRRGSSLRSPKKGSSHIGQVLHSACSQLARWGISRSVRTCSCR